MKRPAYLGGPSFRFESQALWAQPVGQGSTRRFKVSWTRSWSKGLMMKFPCPALDGVEDLVFLAQSGDHHDLCLLVLRQDSTHGFGSIQVGHGDIHEHEVRLELAVLGHGFVAVSGFAGHHQTHVLDDIPEHHPHEFCVIDDEYGVAQCKPPVERRSGSVGPNNSRHHAEISLYQCDMTVNRMIVSCVIGFSADNRETRRFISAKAILCRRNTRIG